MMYSPELSCAEYLLKVLVQKIALVMSDASSLLIITTSFLTYVFRFLLLTNILPSFKKCSMVLQQNLSKNLRVLYCYFLSVGWESKTFDCSRLLIASSHKPSLKSHKLLLPLTVLSLKDLQSLLFLL